MDPRRLLLAAGLSLRAAWAYEPNLWGWTQVFQAGRDPFNGTEMVHLEAYEGALYGGIGFWMNPTHRALEIVRLDSPTGQWQFDGMPSPWAARPEVLKSITWRTDASGIALQPPVSKLVAGYYMNYAGEGRCLMGVRSRKGVWLEAPYYIERPYRERYFTARALAMHRDAVTGVDHLFFSTGMPGIIKASYDKKSIISAKFDAKPESGRFPTRPLGLVVVDGKLYTAGGSFIRRRNDGPRATWSVVFDMADHDSTSVDEAVGGIRGLSMIPNPSGTGESLYFSWCPNSASQGCMVRVDVNGDTYTYNKEACVPNEAKQVLGHDTHIVYTIANYNFALPLPDNDNKLAHLIGYQILLYWKSVDQQPTSSQERRVARGRKVAYYAGAGYMIRRGPKDYEARTPGGPRFCVDEVDPVLVAVRAYARSPFKGDDSIYMGGYDCNNYRSSNTAWILKGTKAAVYSEKVDYGSRLCTSTTTTTMTCTHPPTTTVTTKVHLCDLCQRRKRVNTWLPMNEVSLQQSNGSVVDINHITDGDQNTWGGAENVRIKLRGVHQINKIEGTVRDCPCQANTFRVLSSMDGAGWLEVTLPSMKVGGGRVEFTFDTDMVARFLIFRIDPADGGKTRPRLGLWELKLYGFRELWTPPQVLQPSNIGGENSGVEFTCASSQAHADDPATTTSCRQMQQWWEKRCCAPPVPPAPLSPTDCGPPALLAVQPSSIPTVEGLVDFTVSGIDQSTMASSLADAVGAWMAGMADVHEKHVEIPYVEFVASQGRRLLEPSKRAAQAAYVITVPPEKLKHAIETVLQMANVSSESLRLASIFRSFGLANNTAATVVNIGVRGLPGTVTATTTATTIAAAAEAHTDAVPQLAKITHPGLAFTFTTSTFSGFVPVAAGVVIALTVVLFCVRRQRLQWGSPDGVCCKRLGTSMGKQRGSWLADAGAGAGARAPPDGACAAEGEGRARSFQVC